MLKLFQNRDPFIMGVDAYNSGADRTAAITKLNAEVGSVDYINFNNGWETVLEMFNRSQTVTEVA